MFFCMSCNQGHRLPRKDKISSMRLRLVKTQYALCACQKCSRVKYNNKPISQLAYKHLKAYKLITQMINDKEMINDK